MVCVGGLEGSELLGTLVCHLPLGKGLLTLGMLIEHLGAFRTLNIDINLNSRTAKL